MLKNFTLTRNLAKILLSSQKSVAGANVYQRPLSLSAIKLCQTKEKEEGIENNDGEVTDVLDEKRKLLDRTKVIPVETSIKYLNSSAYKETYGDSPVWEQYRRNHKGHLPPRQTRKTCVRKGFLSTGNPCPVCRDEYLVLHQKNIDLLKQFISPQSGKVISYSKTGLCQKKHLELLVAVEQAMDAGLITFDVPFRKYDYSEFYEKEALEKIN